MRVDFVPYPRMDAVPTNQMGDYFDWMVEQGHYRKLTNTAGVATNEMYFIITYAAINDIEMKRFQKWRENRHKD